MSIEKWWIQHSQMNKEDMRVGDPVEERCTGKADLRP